MLVEALVEQILFFQQSLQLAAAVVEGLALEVIKMV
jgi:hypothetical protein